MGASRSSPSAKLIIALIICTAKGPRLATFAAISSARASPSPFAVTSSTRPRREPLFGGKHCAPERHAPYDRRSKSPYEPLGAGPPGRHAEPGLGKAKLDPAFGNADVRDRRELQAAAERVTGQRCDQGNAQPRKRFESAVSRARPVAPHLQRGKPAPGGDVAAGAKGLAFARRGSQRARLARLRSCGRPRRARRPSSDRARSACRPAS